MYTPLAWQVQEREWYRCQRLNVELHGLYGVWKGGIFDFNVCKVTVIVMDNFQFPDITPNSVT